MYQFSLQYFKQVFCKTVTDAPPSDDLAVRLQTLLDEILKSIFVNICRALFEKHKTLFAFLIAVGVLRQRGDITPAEWAYFLKAGIGVDGLPDAGAASSWIEPRAWAMVLAADAEIDELKGLRKSVMACATQAQGSLISLLSPAVGQALKSHLLACIQSEPKKHIRKKVCDAVGQLGINLLNADQQNGWPELLPFMLQGTRSGDANMHEASLTIFNALADFMCEKMVPYHATLLEVFRGSLQTDQPMAVRIAGLKGLASFLLALQSADTRNHFQELVPLMLQAIAQALTSGEEESCRSALEVFVEIAESQPKFLKRHLHEAVNGMVAIASNTSLEDATRHLALEFLLTVAENMTSAAKKLDRFCETTVPVALSMMLEIDMNTAEELAEWEEREEDDEEHEVEEEVAMVVASPTSSFSSFFKSSVAASCAACFFVPPHPLPDTPVTPN
jgi:hypothetical protein